MTRLRSMVVSFGMAVVVSGGATAWAQSATALPLPDGRGGIGFDDLRYDAASGTLLVPAGRTGNVDLIDPATKAVTPIGGFSKHGEVRLGPWPERDVGRRRRGLLVRDRSHGAQARGRRSQDAQGCAAGARSAARPTTCATWRRRASCGSPSPAQSGSRCSRSTRRRRPADARRLHRRAGRARVAGHRRRARTRLHAQVEGRDDGDRFEDAQGSRHLAGRV